MKKLLGLTVVFVLLLGIALMGLGILLPYHLAASDLSPGPFTLEQQPGSSWRIGWPRSSDTDLYLMEIYQGEKLVYRDRIQGEPSLALSSVPEDQDFTLSVTSMVEFKSLLGTSVRYGETPLEARVRFAAPALTVLDPVIDGDEKTVRLDLETDENALCRFTLLDDSGSVLWEQEQQDPSLTLTFGDGAIPLPEEGERYRLQASVYQVNHGYTVYGLPVETAISHESLQFKALNPLLTETSKNTISLTWDETRGDHYEVQVLDDSGHWTTVSLVDQGGQRRYTEIVAPGQVRQYRVNAVDATGGILMSADPLTFTGRDLTQYATVWPIRDIPAYSKPHGGKPVTEALACTAYCVLEEVDGMFAVRVGDQICYINSNYCLINLPDYLGALCSYNITNSLSSIYTVHEFAVPNVTGVVTAGYEDVYQADESYLVPLLYPTAKKLKLAAESALSQGYRLKIYDSFRPYSATREIYDLTSLILEDPLPDTTHLGIPASALELPEPKEGEDYVTYGWLMTGSSYQLNAFLARDGSAHNWGIALDLTLEDAETGEELTMQTAIHDLSRYSVLKENNDNADLLSEIMRGCGFKWLASEWWHFQDNEAKKELDLNSIKVGVSAQGWVKDDFGWKYRTAKGRFYSDVTVSVDGKDCTFDANGYVTGS